MKFEKILPRNSRRRQILRSIYYKFFSKYTEEQKKYLNWIRKNEPNNEELEKQRNTKFEINPKISIIVPVYNTPEKFFEELVECLEKQTYSNWELCLADGSPEPLEFMKKYPERDNRIKYKIIEGGNKGISGNTNEALTLATGEFIGLLDHDDLLPEFSLFEVVKTINENQNVEFIYSDEDKLETAKGPRYGVFFKPDFSPYTLNSANYICHFSVFKKELMDKIGGFRSEYDGSQDFDIVARASELTNNIVHIPKVLYHWRAHQNSTAQNSDSKPYAFEVGKKVIKDHIKRSLNTEVEVTDGLTPGSYEIRYEVKGNPKVSIIIDGRSISKSGLEKLIKKIKNKITYKNYEFVVVSNNNIYGIKKIIRPTKDKLKDYNKAVLQAEGKHFIILDETLKAIDKPSFIEDLVGICQDENVGIVGTKLYNKNKQIEHCGIVIDKNGTGDLLYKDEQKDIGTYMQRLLIIHNVTSVYFKYAMIDKDIFMEINKFTNEFSGLLASIDICLKILKLQKQVVINPIISFEVTRLNDAYKIQSQEEKIQKKWKENYQKGDTYFSPNLVRTSIGLSIRA